MDYIKEANKYYKIGLDEIVESKKNGKQELAVDGCDKGWLALNLALKAIFVKKGVEPTDLPKGYRGMRYFIKKYGDRNVRSLFERAFMILHIEGFWDRAVDYEEAIEVLEDIKKYMEQIK